MVRRGTGLAPELRRPRGRAMNECASGAPCSKTDIGVNRGGQEGDCYGIALFDCSSQVPLAPVFRSLYAARSAVSGFTT
jgi:hypothetical protein